MGRELTEYCPMCKDRRPLEQFEGVEVSYDPMGPPPMCRRCREDGPPPEDPMKGLSVPHRRALRALLSGAAKSMAEASRMSGLPEGTLSNHLSGKVARSKLRRAYQMALEAEGLDIHSIVKHLKAGLNADRAQWNPSEKQWDHFPDNSTRLKATQTLIRQHDMEYNRNADKGGVNIAIFHNLDDGPRNNEGAPFTTLKKKRATIDVTPVRTESDGE